MLLRHAPLPAFIPPTTSTATKAQELGCAATDRCAGRSVVAHPTNPPVCIRNEPVDIAVAIFGNKVGSIAVASPVLTTLFLLCAVRCVRILAIETGGCPHAAIREDISANLGACETLTARHQAEIVLVESGGGTLSSRRASSCGSCYFSKSKAPSVCTLNIRGSGRHRESSVVGLVDDWCLNASCRFRAPCTP